MRRIWLPIVLSLLAVPWVHAELTALSDDELSTVQGSGVAMVFENFLFSHTNDAESGKIFRINGIKTSKGGDVEIAVKQLYVARAGSDYGANLLPVNLGRLNHPYKIDLVDGTPLGIDKKAVIEISAPSQLPGTKQVYKDLDLDGFRDPVRLPDGRPKYVAYGGGWEVLYMPEYQTFAANPQGYDCLTGAVGMGTCVSRPASADYENGERPDIGFEVQLQVFGAPASGGGSSPIALAPQQLAIHAKSAVFDGSHLRLWSDQNRLVAEFKLNFYTPELTISACTDGGGNCGNEIRFHNFIMELAIGNALQPVYLDVQGGSGNFVLEVKSIAQSAAEKFNVNTDSLATQLGWNTSGGGGTRADAKNKAMWDYFNDYYSNPAYRSNLFVGNLEVNSQGESTNFGTSEIRGLLIQYMKITTHDLAP